MGVLMVVTGRPDAGLDLLTREVDRMHHAYWYVVFGSDELLHSVRSDPRFQAILARERAYSMQQRALLDQMRKAGDVPIRVAKVVDVPVTTSGGQFARSSFVRPTLDWANSNLLRSSFSVD